MSATLLTAAEERAWQRFLAYAPGIRPGEGLDDWEDLHSLALAGRFNQAVFLTVAAALIDHPDAEHRFRLWVDEVKLASRRLKAGAPPQQLAFSL